MPLHNGETYEYDLNWFMSKVQKDDETITYEYDSNGKLKKLSNEYSKYELNYNNVEEETWNILEKLITINEFDKNNNQENTLVSSIIDSSLMYYVELEYPLEEVLYETDYMACLKI